LSKKKQTTRVLAQGKLSSQLSPSKETPVMKGIRKDVNPLSHVQSTPAHHTERGGVSAPPPLNWDLSMISNDQSSMENKSADTSEETSKKTKRKIVPIKSRFMQSAASRATPKATPKTGTKTVPLTGRSSFYTPATGSKSKLSERAKAIEKLNHEDTFTTLPEKPCTPKASSKTSEKPCTPKVASPSVRLRSRTETPKKHPESPKGSTKPPKPLAERKVGSGTPKLGRKVIQSSQKSNVSSDITPPLTTATGALQEVTRHI